MTPDQILAAILQLTSPEPDPHFDVLRNGGHDARYPVTVSACPDSTATLDVEGHTLLCGTVDVPEDHAAPEGRRIPLAFVVGRSHSTNPFPDAVVYLHGGPGGGALGATALATEVVLGPMRAHRDVVTFDQRASMLSSTTVRCYEEMADNIVLLAGGEPLTEEDAQGAATMITDCVDELYASAADLTHYNTEQNARDVRAVMSALGYPTYNIFGISYGTKLALEVLRTAPEGVRSAIIDGVAPPQVRLYDELFPPHAHAIEALFDQCANQPACAEAYPNLRDDFISLGALANRPIPAGRGGQEIDADAFYSIVEARTHYGDFWVRDLTAYLPRIITELARGDATTFDWYLAIYATPSEVDPATITAAAPGLTADERALARAALEVAQSMADQQDTATAVIAQLKADLTARPDTLSVAEAFDQRATAALGHMDRAAAYAAIEDYALFQTRPATRETIATWVLAHFPGPDGTALLRLVAAMSEADVARTFDIAARDLAPYQGVIESALGLFIYACQEDFPYNSPEGAAAVNAAFPYPVILTEDAQAELTGLYETCAAFQPAPRDGFHEPVTSDVPILSLGGTNDVQTSWTWSERAAETLPNSRVVIFPNSGHGSSLFSQCGQDMTATFLLDPAAELDLACVDELVPDFVLPDAPLR